MPDVAGRVGRRRAHRELSRAVAVSLLAAVIACGGPDRRPAERAELQRVLDRQAAAVLGRDPGAYLDTVDPRAARYRAEQRQVIGNLVRLPLAEWSYRITGVDGAPPGVHASGGARRIAVRAELSYRLRGYDDAPLTTREQLVLVERDGRWYVADTAGTGAPGGGGTEQLWEQGRITVVRGARSLVIGTDGDPALLRSLAGQADRAVTAVGAVWPRPWDERVVVEAPASLERMAALLDAPAASYRGVAAVTVGETGPPETAPADRIVINPEAYRTLGESARQIVMIHETAHVATRDHTTARTPLWLSEGFADWLGHRDTLRTPRQVAPALAGAVQEGRPPQELPGDEEFGFGGDTRRLGRAYESGWLACRMIAEWWGTERLTAFYAAVGAGGVEERREAAVDRALREVLGVSREQFTADWRAYLARQLG